MNFLHFKKRRAWLSWLFAAALLALCGYLGFLQYRWIGEVSVAERERMQQRLQADLNRLSLDFNLEVANACRALMPPLSGQLDADFAQRYLQWRKTSRHTQLFRALAIAVPADDAVALRSLDLQNGTLHREEWPAAWQPLRQRMESRLSRREFRGEGPRPPNEDQGTTLEVPLFAMRPPQPFGPREMAWVIFDVNPQYVRDVMLPELIQRNLGGEGSVDYQVDVMTRTEPPAVIYQSDPHQGKRAATSADASVSLFDEHYDQFLSRLDGTGMRGGIGRQAPRGVGGGPPPGFGRWIMLVHHRAGSLEAVVERARMRNLAVTGGVILLLAASIFALVRFTRNAQRLARLQMEFVAGVSHELRTPLSVIYGAAYNLRGTVARNPAQVERYGALLQQESGRLKDLVEQVLLFSSAEAGRAIRDRELLSIRELIEDTMESTRAALESANFVIEKKVTPGLPAVNGDPMALKQSLQNLVNNAVKYAADGDRWLGVFATSDGAQIEIRIADHGHGIPADEQKHIFEPFFRGRRALQDQIHGTGLGLNLVKKIIEAHGGTVRVVSQEMKGTEFIVRIPAAGEAE
jgi:signal transduction histidine kinase